MSVLITAVVVTYNTQKTIEACLRSLLLYLPVNSEIVVVDNASSDETVKLVKEMINEAEEHKIILYELSENLGFGGGNNYAMKRHKASFYYLHNGDAYLQSERTINEALALFEREKGIGIVGLPLVFPDGSVQTGAFAFTSFGKMFLQLLQVHKMVRTLMGYRAGRLLFKPFSKMPMAKSFVNQHLEEKNEAGFQYYDWVCGAALILRDSVLESTGGFDERIFLYGEDELLSFQSTQKGYKTAQVLTEAVVHDFGWGEHKQSNTRIQQLKYEGVSHVIDCYHPQPGPIGAMRRRLMKRLALYHIKMGVT